MSEVKVRIKSGDNEIEVQGSKSEVDGILEVWWARLEPSEAEDDKGPLIVTKDKTKKKKKKKSTTSDEADDSAIEDKFSPSDLANSLKEDAKFSLYQEKVLHQKDVYNKIALICYYADQPLTSGQITNALKALDIKADQGWISNTIKHNSGKFTSTATRKKGGTVPKYKLTSHARSAFVTWLNG